MQSDTIAVNERDADGVPLYTTPHGVVPAQWIRRLPWLVRAPIIFMYCDLLRPGDDFRQQLRKIVFTLGPLLSIVNLSVVGTYWLTLPTDRWDYPAFSGRFNSLCFITAWWTSYIICRATGHASAALADFWLLGTWLGMVVVVLGTHEYPSDQAFMLICILAMLARTPRLPGHVAVNLLGIAVASYNNAAYSRGDPEWPLLSDPAAIMRGAWVRMFFSLQSFGSILFVFAGLQLQMLESDRQTQQAEGNVEVAAGLARMLGDYSTDSATAIIDDATAEKSADPSLLAAFKTLVSNLEQYRPHLPNWMLQQRCNRDDADDGADTEKISDIDVDVTRVTDADSPQNKPSASRRSRPRSIDSPSRASSTSSHSPSNAAAPTRIGVLPPNVAVASTVAAATVHFVVASLDTAAPAPSRARIAEATCAFADRVHELAATTGAAVHSFVGDVVTLSWNAASRALQPELKAARFLLRLRAETGDALVQVGGAAAAGSCRVQLAGSAGKPAALTLHAGWFAALHPLAEFGRDAQTFVVDDGVRSHIEYGAKTRAVAAIASRSRSRDASSAAFSIVLAHELLAEIADGDDEWMYTLNKAAAESAADASGNNAALGKRFEELAVAVSRVARDDSSGLSALLADADALVAETSAREDKPGGEMMWARGARAIRECVTQIQRGPQ